MSASTTYHTSCPKCGQQLTHVTHGPDTAPWGCYDCGYGFWVSELSHKARAMYRPLYHDWGHGLESQALREEVLAEREAARARGTSTLPEHIGLMNQVSLKAIARLPLEKKFRKQLESAIK